MTGWLAEPYWLQRVCLSTHKAARRIADTTEKITHPSHYGGDALDALKKACWYLNWEIEHLEKEKEKL